MQATPPPIIAEQPTAPAEALVIARRVPVAKEDSAASATVIDARRIDALAPPLANDLLRLVPSLALSQSGPAGSLTDVRLRGAEANHTLLFVDGIRANDPAAGNAPRFELLSAALADRVEVVRGPQSALWGSEAIGGVVAVGGTPGARGTRARVEAGSHGTLLASAETGYGRADDGLVFGLASQRSAGIDAFDGHGDRDGYVLTALRVAGTTVLDGVKLSGAAFTLHGASEFDGYDPISYSHADTDDESRNRLSAVRVAGEVGRLDQRWLRLSASLLGSRNRNLLGEDEVNRTSAQRRTLGVEGGWTSGPHRLTLAAEAERESFAARDPLGLSDQQRSRSHQSVMGEYGVRVGPIRADLALRHDLFSRFADATTARASLLAALGGGWALAANWGQGIAQPTFIDLHGYYPAQFSGNPRLRPERSTGGEISLRWKGARIGAAITAYTQRLTDEIVTLYDFESGYSTTANASGRSHRRGIEVEGDWKGPHGLRVDVGYAFLDAHEPSAAGGKLREQRRPRHSGHVAADWQRGRWLLGASLAHVGRHVDTDYDRWPALRLRLPAYWQASARAEYRLDPRLAASLRIANALGARPVDVVGYRQEGRTVHVGLAFRPRG